MHVCVCVYMLVIQHQHQAVLTEKWSLVKGSVVVLAFEVNSLA